MRDATSRASHDIDNTNTTLEEVLHAVAMVLASSKISHGLTHPYAAFSSVTHIAIQSALV